MQATLLFRAVYRRFNAADDHLLSGIHRFIGDSQFVPLCQIVDAAADGALVHLKHLAGGLAIQQETIVFTDKRKDVEQQPQVTM